MSHDMQHGKFIFICDDCGDDIDTDETEFLLALEKIREEGWLITRDVSDQDWLHICNECVNTNRTYEIKRK